MKKILIVIGGLFSIAFIAATWPNTCNTQTAFLIQSDTVQIKNKVASVIGNTLVAIDTCGDYVTGTPASLALFGTPVIDSISTYTGTTQTLAVNTAYVLTATSGFTAIGTNTLSFPSGVSGNWIYIIYNIKDSVITNSGTGAGTIGFKSTTVPTSKLYLNYNGNWR